MKGLTFVELKMYSIQKIVPEIKSGSSKVMHYFKYNIINLLNTFIEKICIIRPNVTNTIITGEIRITHDMFSESM